ncbi:MAG: phosphoribosylamine--glycine ligase, partial [Planctomycetota bacterium]|nr:phosphoribosylamine--glycine ligase [Planctomycetota bacterium]
MNRVPDRINVLLVGGGGREHALAWRLSQSPRIGDLWLTHPENPGLARLGKAIDVPFDTRNPFRLERFCHHKGVNLVVIGPEDPLAAGLGDALATNGRAVFGPGKSAALLEADKAWAKQLMRSASIPTAEARVFTDAESAISYVESRDTPQVVKAAGLAKGKGVFVPENLEEAIAAIRQIMEARVFG